MTKTVTAWFFADSKGHGTCRDRSCNARLVWFENAESGKRMPFVGEPVALRTDTRTDPRTGLDRPVWELDLKDNHFADCPGSKKFSGHPRRP